MDAANHDAHHINDYCTFYFAKWKTFVRGFKLRLTWDFIVVRVARATESRYEVVRTGTFNTIAMPLTQTVTAHTNT